MKEYKPHISEYKRKEVSEIIDLANKFSVIGVVNMEDLPSLQLQRIKQQLRDKMKLKMTKKRLIKIALDQLKDKKKDIEKLKEKLEGMPALIFTNEDPFKLCRLLDKNKSSAPAKAGQIAPRDLVINAGPTPFIPGPIIGELGAAGIKAGVEGGKVVVKEDSILAKKGERITSKAADILTRLKVEPMEVGLNLTLTYEDGEVLTKDILTINEEEYIENIKRTYLQAINLALNISYTTKETIGLLIKKAAVQEKALEEKVSIPEKEKKKEVKIEKPEEKIEIPIQKPEKEEIIQKPKEKKEISIEEIEIKKTELEEEISKKPEPEKVKQDTEDKVIEVKEKIENDDIQKAQQILKELTEKKIKERNGELKEKQNIEDKNINKMVNQLKDKKSMR